jgi:hypothetical protein
MSQKRRPEILKPSLKLLTPYEKQIVLNHGQRVSEMWKFLFSKNKWKPQTLPKNSLAMKRHNATLTNLD